MADGNVALHNSNYKPSKKFNLKKKRHQMRDKTKFILIGITGHIISTVNLPYIKMKIRK